MAEDTKRLDGFGRWIGVGLAMSAIGLACALPKLKFVRSARRTWGVVVDQGVRPGTNDYQVLIEFFDQRDRRLRFSVPAQVYNYSNGEMVPILYDPLNPRNVMVDRFWSVWNIWGLLVLLGPAVCIGAFLLPHTRDRA
jgi:uncharacterized protein DUF3592